MFTYLFFTYWDWKCLSLTTSGLRATCEFRGIFQVSNERKTWDNYIYMFLNLPFPSCCQRVSLVKLHSGLAQQAPSFGSLCQRSCFQPCKYPGGPLGTSFHSFSARWGQGWSGCWVPRLQIWAHLCIPALCYILDNKLIQESARRSVPALCTHTHTGLWSSFYRELSSKKAVSGTPKGCCWPCLIVWHGWRCSG